MRYQLFHWHLQPMFRLRLQLVTGFLTYVPWNCWPDRIRHWMVKNFVWYNWQRIDQTHRWKEARLATRLPWIDNVRNAKPTILIIRITTNSANPNTNCLSDFFRGTQPIVVYTSPALLRAQVFTIIHTLQWGFLKLNNSNHHHWRMLSAFNWVKAEEDIESEKVNAQKIPQSL